MITIINDWEDYECIASGAGEKIDRFGKFVLRRPDPQSIWPINNQEFWNKVDAYYHRSDKGGGHWEFKKKLPASWTIKYHDLTFKVSPTNFKHTGLFPEQAVNWNYMRKMIEKSNIDDIRILNLFAYTGGATMACAKAGAHEVVHVDSSKGIIDWAKENAKLCNLETKKIRFINDDALKFVEREKRRGRTYHGIIMDPPSYGRGPNKETWKLEENLYELIFKTVDLLDKNPLFFIINSYTTGLSPTVLENIMKLTLLKKFPHGKIEIGEIGLPITENNLILPCGIYGKFSL